MPDQIGLMGWGHPGESILRTYAKEEAVIGRMQDAMPARFSEHVRRETVDTTIVDYCKSQMKADGAEDGWDSRYLEKLVGLDLNQVPAQRIGSCVASSHITLLASRAIWEVVVLGQREETLGREITGRDTAMPFGPFSYRVGRAAAGINGNGDGSTCGGQIAGTMKRGYLPCDTSGLTSDAWPEPQSTSLYKRWGASDSYASEWYDEAGKLDLLESERVRDTDTLEARIRKHKLVQICSGWGFGPTNTRLDYRLNPTLYRRSGSWSHSMGVIAVVIIRGDRFWVVRNSWGGNAHRDGGTFIVSDSTMESWLRSAVAMTIGELKQRGIETPFIL